MLAWRPAFRHDTRPMVPPMPKAPSRSRFAGVALVALLCLVWSSTWWVIRICLEEQPPLSSAAIRFLIAGLTMALITPMLQKRENAPPPPTWLWISCGCTTFGAGYGILYCAETVVPSGIAAVLWAIFPLLMAFSSVCFLGERLSVRQWLGFAVSFAGIVFAFASALGGIESGNIAYAWLLLMSPVVATIGTTLVKKYGSKTSSGVLNRNGMLTGAGLLSLAAFVREDPLAMHWSPRVTIATVCLAVFGTTMTFSIYFWLLRTVPASMLALINYVTPVLAMLLAVIVGDGNYGLPAYTGALLVVLGIVLVVRK